MPDHSGNQTPPLEMKRTPNTKNRDFRSLVDEFNKNFVVEFDRAVAKEDEAVRDHLMVEYDADWELIGKEEIKKEAVRDVNKEYVFVEEGTVRKTKTYRSNLAEAGKGKGK